jgi:hypothetical protein
MEMAQNKAYTALLGVSTEEFFDFIQDDPSLLAGIPTHSRTAAWSGGFPIKVDGEIAGRSACAGRPRCRTTSIAREQAWRSYRKLGCRSGQQQRRLRRAQRELWRQSDALRLSSRNWPQ